MPKVSQGQKRLTDVIGNALRVFEALVEEHAKGAEFSLKRASGETVAYKIFV
jgi:hypothetical protein